MQKKLTSGPLLDKNGYLAQAGYATKLVAEYDRNAIKAKGIRIKEWDYYLVTSDDFAVALTMDDNSYMGMMSASIIEFGDNPWEKTTSKIIPFTWGKVGLPSSSVTGDVVYKDKTCDFCFENRPGYRRLKVTYKKFEGKEDFTCDIKLTEEPEDSMVIATPFGKPKTHFYYNQKIIGMKATGTATFKGKTYTFDESNNSYGMLDWGRGVWTYKNTWYWGAGHTKLPDGKVFGFNIGYGFGDTSAASENMIFYDGKAHKLEGVTFNIPQTADGTDDFMSPWTFTSTDGRFEMQFKPIIDRASLTEVGPIGSDQHQVFGHFTGDAKLDDGTVIHVENMLAFAEKVMNKW